MSFLETPWVLASSSPRRQELLKQIIPQFICHSPQGEEDNSTTGSPSELVIKNASFKTAEVAAIFPHAYVLGSDTTVALDNEIFHKPKDLDEAFSMAKRLAGNTHQVHTGVCIQNIDAHFSLSFAEVSEVKFLPYDQARIEKYFSLINPLDKAGGYSIQEHRELIVEEFSGSYFNIMGLPIERIRQELSL